MFKRLIQRISSPEDGQGLVLFAAGLVAMMGFVALSVDVGRIMWARTSIQAGVDAAALAGAQSLPDGNGPAQSYATEYWEKNATFITAQGNNVRFTPNVVDNRTLEVKGEADIPTFFAKFVGLDSWHVSASGKAELSVLDIAVILDTSGSMCYDTFIHSETAENVLMSPGASGKMPKLVEKINSGGNDTITIKLDDVSIFADTSSSRNDTNFGYNSSTTYEDRTISSRNGIIAIHSTTNGTGTYELFDIQSINKTKNEMSVKRAQKNNFTGQNTAKIEHPTGAEVWANRVGCDTAARNGTNGPFTPYDPTISAAKYFTGLFNSQYDQIGLGRYSTNGSKSLDLSSNFGTVKSKIDSLAIPAGNTNIAHGLAVGRNIVNGANSRTNSIKIVVLLTDGIANQYCGSNSFSWSDYNGGCSSNSNNVSRAVSHAKSVADLIGAEGTIIYTIGLGHDLDAAFLADIAARGNGAYYASPTTAQLDEAFRKIAEQTHIRLAQ